MQRIDRYTSDNSPVNCIASEQKAPYKTFLMQCDNNNRAPNMPKKLCPIYHPKIKTIKKKNTRG